MFGDSEREEVQRTSTSALTPSASNWIRARRDDLERPVACCDRPPNRFHNPKVDRRIVGDILWTRGAWGPTPYCFTATSQLKTTVNGD